MVDGRTFVDVKFAFDRIISEIVTLGDTGGHWWTVRGFRLVGFSPLQAHNSPPLSRCL